MQRRTLLGLGVISAAVLAAGGGAIALMRPALVDARLTATGREVFSSIGRATLDGTLPQENPAKQLAIEGLLMRIDTLISALPPHAQAELAQLLALLASAPGRRALAGVSVPWSTASVSEVQQALQEMRVSGLELRRQAYQALHDIVGGAYFSVPQAWSALGYPGPMKI